MELKNSSTGEVIYSGGFKSMKELVLDAINKGVDLRGANLRHADLSHANLRHADLSHANLGYSNLRYSNLRYANLEGANLRGVDLGGVDLRGAHLEGARLRCANLRYANLWGCAGNRREVRSMFISEIYPITYTSEYLQIGCELHKISEWWSFDNVRIKEMDGKEALDFWAENKELIKMAIEKYPATPTN